MGNINNTELTAKQKEELKRLEGMQGLKAELTTKQKERLVFLEKKEGAGTLTDNQVKEIAKLRDIPNIDLLSDAMRTEMERLKAKRDAKPELPEGAKTYVKEVWLWENKAFRRDFESIYTRKGLQAEQDAIDLVSNVEGRMYLKNDRRGIKGLLSGTPDIRTRDKEGLGIIDIKNNWDPDTFIKSAMSPQYLWQGKGYMYLFDASWFELKYCLVDCPAPIYNELYSRFCFRNEIIDDSLEKYQDIITEFNAGLLFAENELYTKEERVKSLARVQRNKDDDKAIVQRLKMAYDYYQTLSLNAL